MKVVKPMAILAAACVLPFLMACPARKKNIAPQPDKELQSSIDVAWATFMITDLDMQCAFMGEREVLNGFYTDIPGTAYTGTNSATEGSITLSAFNHTINLGYNRTACKDGKYRNGSIWMDYGPDPSVFNNPIQAPGMIYTRDYSFGAKINLNGYYVNGWSIKTFNGEHAILRNTLSSASYDPSIVRLTWTLSGRFKFTHPSDSSKNIIWEGKLHKTLLNSTDRAVYNATASHINDRNINWTKGIVSYEVEAKGYTSGNVPFTLSVGSQTPLIRDFSCSPDKVAAVSLSGAGINQLVDEFHPIISGVMSFTTGDLYPRQIYFGNEGLADIPNQCNNSGQVLIKGNTYPVDFIK